jgi:hypothetical protein
MSTELSVTYQRKSTYNSEDSIVNGYLVWNLGTISIIPDGLKDRNNFFVCDAPGILGIPAAQILQESGNKDATPYSAILATWREVSICGFLLTAHHVLGRWRRVFNFDKGLHCISPVQHSAESQCTSLEICLPPLTGLNKAASRSSVSSSSKNPSSWDVLSSGGGLDLTCFPCGTLLFLGITTALEESVVQPAEIAITDEVVQGSDMI